MEYNSGLESLVESLQSLDALLISIEQRANCETQPPDSPEKDKNKLQEEENIHLSDLKAQNARLLDELQHFRLEKENTLTQGPIKEDYDFLLSDRISLQSQLGDSQLRIKELEVSLEDKVHEIRAKDDERLEFMERFQRYETEKISVLKQVLSLEKDLEMSRIELAAISNEKKVALDEAEDVNDALRALREGKKVVENKLARVLSEKDQGQVEVKRLEGVVQVMEESLSERDTALAEKVSFYESQLSGMQVEMNARLEEMNTSNDQTQETIKSRYVDLFEEKVQELFILRSSYEEAQGKLESSERKRLELERELRDLQSQFVSKNEVNAGKVLLLESDLQGVQEQFQALKESCRTSVDQLRQRLRDMRVECDAKDKYLLEIKSKFPQIPQKLSKSSHSNSHSSNPRHNHHGTALNGRPTTTYPS